MKKGCFIIPYFGQLPNYFEVFAKSCGPNRDYSWIIFTDDNKHYELPKNVIIKHMDFQDFVKLLNSKFNFKITIKNYHKICDFKPAFGYIFENYIKDFQFWGYCDLDTIFGNLNDFITPHILNSYDKLFCLGHCVLFKNNYENNRLFMRPVNNELWYKESFSTTETTIFDETYGDEKNINTIFKYYNKKVLEQDWSFNCNIATANLRRKFYVARNNIFKLEKYRDAIFVWNTNGIFRYYIENDTLVKKEYMYMHFQSRKMNVEKEVLKEKDFKILGNGFYPLEKKVTKENFPKIKHKIHSLRRIRLIIYWKVYGLIKRLKICN